MALIAGGVGVLLVLIDDSQIRPAGEVVLRVGEPAGQRVRATYSVDGILTEEKLVTPIFRILQGSEVLFWLERVEGPGDAGLDVELHLGDQKLGTCQTGAADRGVRGGVRTPGLIGLRREVSFLEEASREEIRDRWLPPGFELGD